MSKTLDLILEHSLPMPDAWKNIYSTHGFAKNMTEAAAIGINAGMDQEGTNGPTVAIDQIPGEYGR